MTYTSKYTNGDIITETIFDYHNNSLHIINIISIANMQYRSSCILNRDDIYTLKEFIKGECIDINIVAINGTVTIGHSHNMMFNIGVHSGSSVFYSLIKGNDYNKLIKYIKELV